jgi:hypothetical protein
MKELKSVLSLYQTARKFVNSIRRKSKIVDRRFSIKNKNMAWRIIRDMRGDVSLQIYLGRTTPSKELPYSFPGDYKTLEHVFRPEEYKRLLNEGLKLNVMGVSITTMSYSDLLVAVGFIEENLWARILELEKDNFKRVIKKELASTST